MDFSMQLIYLYENIVIYGENMEKIDVEKLCLSDQAHSFYHFLIYFFDGHSPSHFFLTI